MITDEGMIQQNYPILPYGYAVQPPPPVLPYQPPVIPTYQSHWNNSGSSVKTVSDVENYMHNQKIHDIPCWKPNSYQQMPLYCENRSDWEFVIRAITHRAELEPIMKELDIKRESEKNTLLLHAMSDTINPAINEFKLVAQSQNDLLLAQSAALKALLESKPSSTHDDISSPQPLHPLSVTTDTIPSSPTPLHNLAVQSLPSMSESNIPTQPTAQQISFPTSVEDRLRNINDYIQTNIHPVPQSEPETPVSQAELDALTTVF